MKGICLLTSMALGFCVGGVVVYKNQMIRKMMQEKENAIMKKFEKVKENIADFIDPEDEKESKAKPQNSKPKSTAGAKAKA